MKLGWGGLLFLVVNRCETEILVDVSEDRFEKEI